MSNLVIYSSKYGSTKDYAHELAKKLSWEAVPYRKANNNMLNDAESIVLASSVRMGKLTIAAWAKSKSAILKDKCKAFVAVGGTESENQDYYVETVEKSVPFLSLKKEQIFGCGGRQVVSEMKGFDSFVFKMLDKMVKDPKEKEDIMGDKDHVDMALLDPIVKYIKQN
jgi:menaquinone-dependent protoporphyrinogen IX oxidase